jgi:hypothetical protein
LKIQDETVGMTPVERTEYYNKKSAAFLSSQGKLKPCWPVT